MTFQISNWGVFLFRTEMCIQDVGNKSSFMLRSKPARVQTNFKGIQNKGSQKIFILLVLQKRLLAYTRKTKIKNSHTEKNKG